VNLWQKKQQIMNNKISILGCGWLGLPLAEKFIKNSFEVKGSTTSESKLALLADKNIQSFLIALFEDKIEGNIEGFLAETDVLIIDIPPKLRGLNTENFVAKIKTLVIVIEKFAIKKVLFVSSTSVYADTFPIVELNEDSIPNPDSEGGKQLLEVEQLLQSNKNFETTILRFGGLIGEDRHPIKFLAGRENVENPEAPINFIHQKDCIGIIENILSQNCWGETFNAAAPNHPERRDYYHKKALEMNLKVPTFVKDSKSKGKIISSQKLQRILNYTFQKEI
jgi:nucleoside-diphosphate-sugar epimerase